MRTHHALQPRTPEQASYSIDRRDGKQFLKLYRSYLHGTLAGTREPVYEGTVVESADDWRLTAVLALAPMTLAFAYLIVMLFSCSCDISYDMITAPLPFFRQRGSAFCTKSPHRTSRTKS